MKWQHCRSNRVVFMLLTTFAVVGVSPVSYAADNPTEWNKAWTGFQTVLVQETAGFDREREPVEAELKYFQTMPGQDTTGVGDAVRRAVRVVHKTDAGKWEEIPCQVYDVRPYYWNRRAEKTEVMVRSRVVFFASVPANMTGTYCMCYGNPDFMFTPGDFPTTWFQWYYAHNFRNPPCETVTGPLFFSMKRSQLVPGQDIAWMEVYYRFYDGLPYFVMESRIVTKKQCHTLAIRNDELAFGSDDFTHAGWRNYTVDMLPGHIGEIGSVDIYNEARMGNHVIGSALPPNIPWISLCNVNKVNSSPSMSSGSGYASR